MSRKIALLLISLCILVDPAYQKSSKQVSAFDDNGDFIPHNEKQAKFPTKMREMTKEEMLHHRQHSESYKEFLNGKFVATIHTMLRPLVRETGTAIVEPSQDPFGDWIAAPWDQNLLRWELRENVRPYCYWWGFLEVLYIGTVQAYYDCATWLDMDFLAFQTKFCIIFICPLPSEVWTGGISAKQKVG